MVRAKTDITSDYCVTQAVRLVGNSMDAEYLDQADRLNYATQAQVWATLALVLKGDK